MCDELAAQPLQREPGHSNCSLCIKLVATRRSVSWQRGAGSCYTYSFCTDMIGRVCEAVSGKRLEAGLGEIMGKKLGGVS